MITISIDKVNGILGNMGTDADAVARTLEAAGVRGERWSFTDDPVGNYLKKLLKTYVEATEVAIYWDACGKAETAYTPPAVRDFMQRFDGGAYDHLVAHEVRKGSRVFTTPNLADAILNTDEDEDLDERSVVG